MSAATMAPPGPPVMLHRVGEILLVAVLYAVAARIGLQLAMPGGHVTPVWPPSGLALLAVLLRGRRIWPGVWLGSFAANIVDFHDSSLGMLAAFGTPVALASGASLAAVWGGYLVRRWAGPGNPLDRVSDVAVLLALGGLVACLVSSLVGVTALRLTGYGSWETFGRTWITWWLGDTAGVWTVTPLLLAWSGRRWFGQGIRWAELTACFGLLGATTWYVFLESTSELFANKPLTFLLSPMLVWPAVRFGKRGATFGVALITVLATWGTIHQTGPFGAVARQEALLLLELFLSVMVLTALLLAAAVAERETAEAQQRRAFGELEDHVQERTAALAGSEHQARAHLAEAEKARAALLSILEDERATEAALRSSEERFRTIFEQAPLGISEGVVATASFVRINQRYADIVGYSIAELLRLTYKDFTHPDDLAADMAQFQRLAAGEIRAYAMEKRYVRKDGTVVWVNLSLSALGPAGIPPVNCMAMIEDVTQRKTADLEIKRREERFRRMIEHNSDLITLVDPTGVIRFQSASVEPLLGYRPAELMGRNALEIVHPDDRAAVQEGLGRAVAGESEPKVIEFRLRHRDGSWRFVESIGAGMEDVTGDRLVVINSRDVTRSRELGEQLRQSQKMEAIGQLSGGIAHDFNNLLTVIRGQIGLLRLNGQITPAMASSIGDIDEAAKRAAKLTHQLLAFSRKQVMQRTTLDMAELVTDLTRLLTRLLEEDIHLELRQQAPGGAVIHGDRGMIEQVLINLAVNARDAMAKGGRLVIETSKKVLTEQEAGTQVNARPGRFVVVAVTDTGTGIAPEILPRIFEPFFTTKEVGRGTGLGLATAYGIVQQHQGWISVESAVGQGTTFRIYLPAMEAAADAPEAKEHRTGSPLPGAGEWILLVEDDSAVRELAAAALASLGYQVLTARTGREALAIWREHREEIQLLLTDLVMPGGMTGRELVEILRGERPGLRVVVTSGYSPEIAGRDFPLREGLNYLGKPFDLHALAKIARAALENDGSAPPLGGASHAPGPR